MILVVIRFNPLSSSSNSQTDWMSSGIEKCQDLALKRVRNLTTVNEINGMDLKTSKEFGATPPNQKTPTPLQNPPQPSSAITMAFMIQKHKGHLQECCWNWKETHTAPKEGKIFQTLRAYITILISLMME